MSKITIKNPSMTVEVFNKAGSSMGTFIGQQATNIVVSLQRGFTGFITATNTAGVTVSINPDCVCSMTQSVETEEISFDDESKPFGCCGENRGSASAPSVPVTGISLAKTDYALKVMRQAKLDVTIAPASATNKDLTYTSSDTSIATVDKNGVIVGKFEGTAVIVVTTADGGKTAIANVKVTVE